jgi:hypothetical protein
MKTEFVLMFLIAMSVEAFTVQRTTSLKSLPSAVPRMQQNRFFMSENGDTEQKPKQGGNVYDDEVAPYKDPISNSMRERLLREASSGLDADKAQTNVILYISIGVAILVILGGNGIFF